MIRKQSHIFLAIPLVLALSACATAEQASAPAFASSSYMGPGGRIVGDVRVDFRNRENPCGFGTDIFLVPATSANVQQVKTDFGRTDLGVVVQAVDTGDGATSNSGANRLYPEAISVKCRYNSRFFQFDNIAPGAYFLMTALEVRGLAVPSGQLPTTIGGLTLHEGDVAKVHLMEQITVQPSKSTRVTLEYQNS